MNTKEILLKTADFIATNPDLYDFGMVAVPTSELDVGCAIGWLGYFAGTDGSKQEGNELAQICHEVLGLSPEAGDSQFYNLLPASVFDPAGAIETLRHLATKY